MGLNMSDISNDSVSNINYLNPEKSFLSNSANWKKDSELEKVVSYILQLRDPEKRENALTELSKKRESFSNLAPLLWHSIGTIAIL